MSPWKLYLITAAAAFAASLALTPLARALGLRFVLDTPSGGVKTHKNPTPLLGGLAIAAAFIISLSAVRLFTSFPTGTLHTLRGFFAGAVIMLLLGLVDDIKKPSGLSVATKFAFQIAAALVLVHYGVRIRFIQPDYLAVALTVVWVVGVANAFNIIDIMDGLCASQAAAASLGFLLIALPSEDLYVNFAAAALLGAAAGFLPHNFSRRRKIFAGDCGSLFMGYTLAALSVSTQYSHTNPLGVYAPLLILAVPIYDTFFVSFLRIRRGNSPFAGSKDHYALRLEKMGFSRHEIVAWSAVVTMGLVLCAFSATQLPIWPALVVYAADAAAFALMSVKIARVEM
ncbi:MAG: MraY family glycosyltransferase [Elusimicrobiales bacterium]